MNRYVKDLWETDCWVKPNRGHIWVFTSDFWQKNEQLSPCQRIVPCSTVVKTKIYIVEFQTLLAGRAQLDHSWLNKQNKEECVTRLQWFKGIQGNSRNSQNSREDKATSYCKSDLEKIHHPALPAAPLLHFCVVSFFPLFCHSFHLLLFNMRTIAFPPCCNQHCKDN